MARQRTPIGEAIMATTKAPSPATATMWLWDDNILIHVEAGETSKRPEWISPCLSSDVKCAYRCLLRMNENSRQPLSSLKIEASGLIDAYLPPTYGGRDDENHHQVTSHSLLY